MNEMPDSLLEADEPAPVTVHNENGLSPFLIVADHAGNCMPRALGRLGISETDCERHIAWDIGIAAVSRLVADALDACVYRKPHLAMISVLPGKLLSLTKRKWRSDPITTLKFIL